MRQFNFLICLTSIFFIPVISFAAGNCSSIIDQELGRLGIGTSSQLSKLTTVGENEIINLTNNQSVGTSKIFTYSSGNSSRVLESFEFGAKPVSTRPGFTWLDDESINARYSKYLSSGTDASPFLVMIYASDDDDLTYLHWIILTLDRECKVTNAAIVGRSGDNVVVPADCEGRHPDGKTQEAVLCDRYFQWTRVKK